MNITYENFPLKKAEKDKEEVLTKLPALKTQLLNFQVSAAIARDEHFRNFFNTDKTEINYGYTDSIIFKELCDFLSHYIIKEEKKIGTDPTLLKLSIDIEKLSKKIETDEEHDLKIQLQKKRTAYNIRKENLISRLDAHISKTKFTVGERSVLVQTPIDDLIDTAKVISLREKYNCIEKLLKL